MKLKRLLTTFTAAVMIFSLMPVTAFAMWLNDYDIEKDFRTLQCDGDGELEVRFFNNDGELMYFYQNDDTFVVDEPGLKDEYIKEGILDSRDFLVVSEEVVKIEYPTNMFGHLEVIVKQASGYTFSHFSDVTCGCYTSLENKDGVYIVTSGDIAFLAANFIEDESDGDFTETATQNLSMTLNGVPIYTDVPPYIENDRTMVPVRFISEALDAVVDWDGSANLVSVYAADGTIISLTIGEADMMITKKDSAPSFVTMDAPALINDGRTYVPVRYVAEALGLTVDWDGETRTVIFN